MFDIETLETTTAFVDIDIAKSHTIEVDQLELRLAINHIEQNIATRIIERIDAGVVHLCRHTTYASQISVAIGKRWIVDHVIKSVATRAFL